MGEKKKHRDEMPVDEHAGKSRIIVPRQDFVKMVLDLSAEGITFDAERSDDHYWFIYIR